MSDGDGFPAAQDLLGLRNGGGVSRADVERLGRMFHAGALHETRDHFEGAVEPDLKRLPLGASIWAPAAKMKSPGERTPGTEARGRRSAVLLVSVGLDVLLGSLAGVVQRVLVVGAREVRMVRGLLVVPVLVVVGGLPVVTGSLLVVVGGLVVMLGGFLRHDQPPTGS